LSILFSILVILAQRSGAVKRFPDKTANSKLRLVGTIFYLEIVAQDAKAHSLESYHENESILKYYLPYLIMI